MSEAKAERPTNKPDNDDQEKTYYCMEQLAIVERFEQCFAYLYPVLLGIPRAHYIARDQALTACFDQVRLFNEAGKSTSLSKLYAADANIAQLRFLLRFLSDPKRKLISQHQHQVASIHLGETGRMLGGWIARAKRDGKR